MLLTTKNDGLQTHDPTRQNFQCCQISLLVAKMATFMSLWRLFFWHSLLWNFATFWATFQNFAKKQVYTGFNHDFLSFDLWCSFTHLKSPIFSKSVLHVSTSFRVLVEIHNSYYLVSFRWHLKSQPFHNLTGLDHSNTKHFWCLDPHCVPFCSQSFCVWLGSEWAI